MHKAPIPTEIQKYFTKERDPLYGQPHVVNCGHTHDGFIKLIKPSDKETKLCEDLLLNSED